MVEARSGNLRVAKLSIAARFWPRFWGWQLRRRPADTWGLLIAPCRSIHTVGMLFVIDVAFLDAEGLVLRVVRRVRPFRALTGPPGTAAVLETPADALAVEAGERLAISAPNTDESIKLPPGGLERMVAHD